MKRALSEIILPNYWDLLEDGIGEQLEQSRKMFLRGGRFSCIRKKLLGCASHYYFITLISLHSC